MTDSLSYDEILSHYEKYIRSNISIREYAKENGVSLTIYNWFKKFNLPVSTKRRRQKVYPDQQILTLHQEYLKSGLTISEFASQKTISKDTLAFRFRKLKLTIKPTSEHVRKYTVNHGYFNEIDTEEKAYFLGLLYADGCNVKGNNAVVLCLAEQDIDMLKRFATAIEFEFHGRPQIKHNNPNSQPMYRIEKHSSYNSLCYHQI
jgi:transposase